MSKRFLTHQQKNRILDNQSTEKKGREQLLEGQVISHNGYLLTVKTSEDKLIKCNFRSNISEIVTGDYVSYSLQKNSKKGIVSSVINRKNLLSRPNKFSHKIKAIAANINQIYIVIAVEPEPIEHYIDRYIVAAELMKVKPIIVFNKTDLLSTENKFSFEPLLKIYENIGYEVIQLSAIQTTFSSELKQSLQDKCSIFIGQSGVGKSALLNQIIGQETATTGDISETNKRGKHTTTTSRLYEIEKNTSIIDSPGIREFDLWDISEQELLSGFTEISRYAISCKFRNCRHTEQEQKCAVIEAANEGKISQVRLKNFYRVREDIK